MADKFSLQPLVRTEAFTYRGGTKVAPLTDADLGKAVSLVGPSQVDLAVADGEILGFVSSVEMGTLDGFVIVGIREQDYQEADTAAIAVGTGVVVASNPAKGTAGKTVVKAGAAVNFKWVVVRPGLLKRV